MEDIKIYGHLISGISDDNSSYSNGDNWIAEAHDIYDEEFKNLSEEIVEGSLPIERQDQINRYLYNKVDDIQDKLNNYKLYSIVASLPTSNIDKNKIYIVASEEGVENNIYTEYIYTNSNTWEKLGEFKADIDIEEYAKISYVDSQINDLDKTTHFISGYKNSIITPNKYDAIFSTKTIENDAFSTGDDIILSLSFADSTHAGMMKASDKEKLDAVVKDTEPIIFTLSGQASIFDDPWSIIPTVGQTKTLTDEELQKSNLINLYKILDSNNPIIINQQGVNAKHYYIKEKFGSSDLDEYGIVVQIEDKELKIEHLTFTTSNPNGGVSTMQSTSISSKYIHQHVDDSSVNDQEYCLIKKQDYNDILRRLSALEG